MRTDYKIRARKFIVNFFPYIRHIDFEYGGHMEIIKEISAAVWQYNKNNHGRVVWKAGSSRIVLLNSDYVIKIDYDDTPFGGCEDEAIAYKESKTWGYEDLFMEISTFYFNGFYFFIMPRAKVLGTREGSPSIYQTVSQEESEFLLRFFGDIHEANYGYWRGRWRMIDYAYNAFAGVCEEYDGDDV